MSLGSKSTMAPGVAGEKSGFVSRVGRDTVLPLKGGTNPVGLRAAANNNLNLIHKKND
jgi:hypothetical protein